MSTSPPSSTRPARDDTVAPRLRDIVAAAADLEPREVTDDALFYDDLAVDSLQKLEIVVRIERGFGIRLTDTEATALNCVSDAVRLLRTKDAYRR